ncbi:MAG: hypothetical protein LAP13_18325 [Acidobacteriia bacterium]|nr:hypothetical protein [Terriglobia bacterium]
MAGRQRTTFQKRQKEVKRLEKAKLKAEKRAARRLERAQSRAAASETPVTPPQFDLSGS